MTKAQVLQGLPWIFAISFLMLWGLPLAEKMRNGARYVSLFLWALVKLRHRTAAVNQRYWRDLNYWKAMFSFANTHYLTGIVVEDQAWGGVFDWRTIAKVEA
ncbi:hypothetical protein [Comamonas thiooxydans]|uniref:hypothetical protein n=1 Tax=Comamonas thiooxydans TaxID=363952 RepID=UPI000B41A0FC|nr:hypothetical protein [Comamonas thiooxydans]